MSDSIRMDQEELTLLTQGLRRLSEDMEMLEWRLQLCRYRLSSEALWLIDMQLLQIRRRMNESVQTIQEMARTVIRLDDEFSACEHGIKRYFSEEGLRMDGMAPKIPGYGPENHLHMPFTPKYEHFVRKATPKRTERI